MTRARRLLALALLAGCGRPPAPPPSTAARPTSGGAEYAVDETGAGSPQVIPVGGTLTIKLRDQPGTGYRYRHRPIDTRLLQLVDSNSAPAPGTPPGLVGGFRVTAYVFSARAPGAAVVTFDLTAPGGAIVDGKTLRYAIEIESPARKGAP